MELDGSLLDFANGGFVSPYATGEMVLEHFQVKRGTSHRSRSWEKLLLRLKSWCRDSGHRYAACTARRTTWVDALWLQELEGGVQRARSRPTFRQQSSAEFSPVLAEEVRVKRTSALCLYPLPLLLPATSMKGESTGPTHGERTR
jgi:hypothetical protein